MPTHHERADDDCRKNSQCDGQHCAARFHLADPRPVDDPAVPDADLLDRYYGDRDNERRDRREGSGAAGVSRIGWGPDQQKHGHADDG